MAKQLKRKAEVEEYSIEDLPPEEPAIISGHLKKEYQGKCSSVKGAVKTVISKKLLSLVLEIVNRNRQKRLNREQNKLNDMFRRLDQIENELPIQVMKVHALQQRVDDKTKKKKEDAEKDLVLNQIAQQQAQLKEYAKGVRNGAVQPGGHPSITRQPGPIPKGAKALPPRFLMLI
mmetsp:Transcript_3798/g.5829  ORF Transcript_3798/g.5829 Transcript_3798/m.5829 type:complete len:175 (-) Transcript_3798:214-738(-)